MVTPGLLSLPVEDVLFTQIFSRLHPLEVWALRQVCSYLYTACSRYFLSPACDRVHFNDTPVWTCQLGTVMRILSMCRYLKELSLVCQNDEQIIDTCILVIPSNISLRVLKLSCLQFSNPRLCIQHFDYRTLQVLHLESIANLDDNCFQPLLVSQEPLNLVKLSLLNLPKLRNSVPMLIVLSKQLRVLTLRNTGSVQQTAALEGALKGCSQLRKISVSFMSCVTERTFLVLAEYCKKLVEVRVDHCPAVSGQGMSVLLNRGVTGIIKTTLSLRTVVPAADFEINQI